MAHMEVVVPRYHVTEFYIVRYFSCMSFLCLMQNRKRQVSGYQECLHLGRHAIMTTFAFSNPKQWRKKRLQVHTRHKFQCIPIANSIPKHCFQYTVAKVSIVAKELGSFFKISPHWFLKQGSFLVRRLIINLEFFAVWLQTKSLSLYLFRQRRVQHPTRWIKKEKLSNIKKSLKPPPPPAILYLSRNKTLLRQ